jgi:protein-S-isoprenylcysteine O-methyltransferase Ste14
MRKLKAAAMSVVFFLMAPATVAGVIPWLITRWRFQRPVLGRVPARPVGAGLIAAGLVPLVSAFAEFVKAGGGTPVPVASSERLVVSGFHRHVRNPTYDGLLLAIIGQALLFGNNRVLAYAAVWWAANAWFVGWYEEPTMVRRFGADYEAYRRAVPAWLPRLHPWTPNLGGSAG